MADLIRLPVQVAGRVGRSIDELVIEPVRDLVPTHEVDDWGRDAHLIRVLGPLARLRWQVSVGGQHHLPSRGGALLVTNNRRWSLSPVYGAWALSEAVGRPVRFIGRPDVAPLGPFMRRIGGLLAHTEEIAAALRNHELVLMPAASTGHPRHAGAIDHRLLAAAVLAKAPVFPVASMSSVVGRAARVEIGPQLRPRHKRRGPLAEVELAEMAQQHIQRLLDGLGGMQTGMAPIDWLAEG
jgi:1-acyl-sn-glycerol-3-phosphate acyltransferase